MPPAGIVLAYHRVGAGTDTLTVAPGELERQLEILLGLGFRPSTLRDVVDGRLRGAKDPFVAVTFDDGYAELPEHAVPVLERLGFTATFFVIPDLVGRDLRERGSFMSWNEVRGLHDAGFDVGSHTLTHAYLDELDDAECRHELSASRDAIATEIGSVPQAFCYPAGRVSARAVRLVEETGYDHAVVTPVRRLAPETRFTVRRVGVYAHTTPAGFRAKLSRPGRAMLESGWAAALRALRPARP